MQPCRGCSAEPRPMSIAWSSGGTADDAMKLTARIFSARLFVSWSFAISVALLFGCKGNTSSPTQPDETSTVSRTLDDLDASIVHFSALYNGFPVYPVQPRPASVVVTILVHNTSATQSIDTLILDHATLFDKSTQQVVFTFSFDMISKIDGSDWCGTMDPGQQDTLWCAYHFDHALAPCNDSVFVDVTLFNRYDDSLTVRTPTALYECSE
jgi:hypothetical protein